MVDPSYRVPVWCILGIAPYCHGVFFLSRDSNYCQRFLKLELTLAHYQLPLFKLTWGILDSAFCTKKKSKNWNNVGIILHTIMGFPLSFFLLYCVENSDSKEVVVKSLHIVILIWIYYITAQEGEKRAWKCNHNMLTTLISNLVAYVMKGEGRKPGTNTNNLWFYVSEKDFSLHVTAYLFKGKC